MPSAFISYVRENAAIVDKLAAELRRHGMSVWLDREQLMPGMRWQQAIRKAIRSGDFFIACFSAESVARARAFQNEEIVLAIEELRLRPEDRIWFIPVLLSTCEVPDRDIGGGQTLNSIQWVDLYQSWDNGIHRILKVMGVEESSGFAIDRPIHLDLVSVPAGPFLMGVNKLQVDLMEFYIGKYPVTNTQYAAFVAATGFRLPDHWPQGRIPSGKADHPVVWVSWDEAAAFCAWLGPMSGLPFLLPSEAEWEKAARGTDGRTYPWGEKLPNPDLCNFKGSNIGATTPVGQYPLGASPYGALDMAGNVWEWTAKDKHGWPRLKGGSWASEAERLKIATVEFRYASVRQGFGGFRLAAVPIAYRR